MSSDTVLARAAAPARAWRNGALRRVLAVAGMTLREAVRRKVLIAGAVMTLGYLALYWLGAHSAAGDMARSTGPGLDQLMNRIGAAQLLYVGLVPAAFIIGLTAVFASVGSISSELDTGVMYGVLARPIRRGELVLGKALGLAAMLVVYSALINGAVIGIARWQLKTPLSDVPGALLLFALEPIVLIALAMLCTVRLPTLASGVLCTVAYGIASAGGLMEQIGAFIKNTALSNIGIVSSLLMPVDAVHRKALSVLVPQGLLIGDLANMGSGGGPFGMGISATPSVWMLVYAFGYIGVLMFIAVRAFRRRDL